jgi:hypothetical protein
MIRTVVRGRDFSDLHDGYCRCRGCKPPHPADRTNTLAILIGLALLVLALVVTL